MLLNFRQGIVEAQIPTFFRVTYPTVDLIVTDTNTTVAFACGEKDYLYTEQSSVANAWGPLHLGIDQWLYWDLDIRSGNRTFGITIREPAVSAIAPTSPTMDQHWFDTTTNEMKVWSGNVWVKKIRTFAMKLTQGRIPVSMSVNSPSFLGTQIGNSSISYAGHILYDATTNNAIKNAQGQFMTTEDHLSTKTISLSQVKVASIIVEGEAQQNLASHTIVRFSEFGKIVHADQFIAEQPLQFGIIEQSAVVGQTVNVVTSGMVSSEAFDFSEQGVNTLLYCNASGQLVNVPVIPSQHPVAIVVDRKTIQLGVAVMAANDSGGVELATELVFGISRLSVPAEDENDPIVVGDNDPRLTNARPPQIHTHTIPQVIDLPEELDNRVLRSGDTMTGILTLSGAPTSSLHAATKQYVDDSRTPAAGNQFQVQYNINDEFTASGNLQLDLPDNPHIPMNLFVGDNYYDRATITTNTNSGILQVEGGGRMDAQPGAAVLQGGVLVTSGNATEAELGYPRGGSAIVSGGPGQGIYGTAGDAIINGGSGEAANGRVFINGGTNFDTNTGMSTRPGGSVTIAGGLSQGVSAFNGGDVTITGGDVGGSGAAGNVYIRGGVSATGAGGGIEIATSNVHRVTISRSGEWLMGDNFAPGDNGMVLTSRGTNQPPVWTTPAASITDRIVSGDAMVRVTNNNEIPPRCDTTLGAGTTVISSTKDATTYFDHSVASWETNITYTPWSGDQYSYLTTMVVDATGNIYFSTTDDNNSFTTVVTKLDSTGNHLWSRNLSTEYMTGYGECRLVVGTSTIYAMMVGYEYKAALFELSPSGDVMRTVELGDMTGTVTPWMGRYLSIAFDEPTNRLYIGGSSFHTNNPTYIALDTTTGLSKVAEFEIGVGIYADQGGQLSHIVTLSNGNIACVGEVYDKTNAMPPIEFISVIVPSTGVVVWTNSREQDINGFVSTFFTGMAQVQNRLVVTGNAQAQNGTYNGRPSFQGVFIDQYQLSDGAFLGQRLLSSPVSSDYLMGGDVIADPTNPGKAYIAATKFNNTDHGRYTISHFDTTTQQIEWTATYLYGNPTFRGSVGSYGYGGQVIQAGNMITGFTVETFSAVSWVERPVIVAAPIPSSSFIVGNVSVTTEVSFINEDATVALPQIVPTMDSFASSSVDNTDTNTVFGVIANAVVTISAVTLSSAGHMLDVQGTTRTRQISVGGSTGQQGYVITHTGAGPVWAPDYYSTFCDLNIMGDIVDDGEWIGCYIHPEDGFTQLVDMDNWNESTHISNASKPWTFVLPTNLAPGRRHCFRLLMKNSTGSGDSDVFEDGGWHPVDYAINWLTGGGTISPGNGWTLYEAFSVDGGASWFCAVITGGSND